MKIGFIGTGNMATGIISGLKKDTAIEKSIFVYNHHSEKTEAYAAKMDVTGVASSQALVEESDIVVLAAKPVGFPNVVAEICKAVQAKKIPVISIAAGITTAWLSEQFGAEVPAIRVMPNMNAVIGESMSGIAANDATSEAQLQQAEAIFQTVGAVERVSEEEFSIFTAIAGSAPAFAFLYMDSIARGAVKAGMNKQKALRIAAQTVLGSAKMILESEEEPWPLIDKVCSPGGTTIAGVDALLDNSFVPTVMKSVAATIKRDKEMEQDQ